LNIDGTWDKDAVNATTRDRNFPNLTNATFAAVWNREEEYEEEATVAESNDATDCADDTSSSQLEDKDCEVLQKMGKCSTSKVLRFHCRKTCSACNENFDSVMLSQPIAAPTKSALMLLDLTITGPLSKLAAAGCMDEKDWSSDCMTLQEHCSTSNVLRGKCRKTCNACTDTAFTSTPRLLSQDTTQLESGFGGVLDNVELLDIKESADLACADLPEWAQDCVTLHAMEQCTTSKVLRSKCRRTCNACDEEF